MKYIVLLWPHANARYRTETQKLATAEAQIMLGRVCPQACVRAAQYMDMPAVEVETSEALDERSVAALQGMSLIYGLFEALPDGALKPVAGREKLYLGEDLPGILKYKGKTNELFTLLLVNAALYSSDFWREDRPLRMLDPMCGRGTTLFTGANRGWMCVGSDLDKSDLKEAEVFFKRYLEYHRFKYTLNRGSLTVKGGKAAPCVQFDFSDTNEHFKQKQTAGLKLVNLDAADVRGAFGMRAFDLIACDLPYGVQHASQGGSLEALLAKVLPGWFDAVAPGGAVVVSFNAQTLPVKKVWAQMEHAGFAPLCEGPYTQFSHWVEQAVTRDVAVCRKER